MTSLLPWRQRASSQPGNGRDTDDALVVIARFRGGLGMRTALDEFTEQYSAALREYCAKGGEALSWAFQPSLLGHRAAGEGLGVLEMAAIHQKALVEARLEMAGDESTHIARRASEFLAEALAPFE